MGAGAQRSRLHRTTSLARSACPTVCSSRRYNWNITACRRGSAFPAGDCISRNAASASCCSVAMSSARCGMSVLFSSTNAATAAAAARSIRSHTAFTSSAADLCSALPAMKQHCTRLPTRSHQIALKASRSRKLYGGRPAPASARSGQHSASWQMLASSPQRRHPDCSQIGKDGREAES